MVIEQLAPYLILICCLVTPPHFVTLVMHFRVSLISMLQLLKANVNYFVDF